VDTIGTRKISNQTRRGENVSENRKIHALESQKKRRSFERIEKQSIFGEINKCKNKFIQHVRRMDTSGLPHAIMKYQPAEIRNPECLLEEIWIVIQ
jgi:hypothetical protein